jgi:hypothetical protein
MADAVTCQLLDRARHIPVVLDADDACDLAGRDLSVLSLSIPPCPAESPLGRFSTCQYLRRSYSPRPLTISASSNGEASYSRRLIDGGRRKRIDAAYMGALHDYNAVKDAALTLLGQLAEAEAMTVKGLYARYGLDPDTD